jgi:hypothetical protein
VSDLYGRLRDHGHHSRVHAPVVRFLRQLCATMIKNCNSCKDCIVSYLETCAAKGEQGKCPTCSQGPVVVSVISLAIRSSLMELAQESDLLEVVRKPKAASEVEAGEVTLRRNNFRSSTKLEALIHRLREHNEIPARSAC